MRAPHPNTPEPPSPRLRVGEFIADLPARELRRADGGDTHKMTVKTQGVLVALARQPGQVVTREELMDQVWPNTFPTGDVLTQAITALRRAFGDSADAPRYVETIAKSGYRLLAPVEWLPELPAPERPALRPDAANDAPAPARAPGRRLLALLVLAGLVAPVAWWLWPKAPAEAGRTPSPIATAAALETTVIAASPESEVMPRLSPDGSQVVYARAPTDSNQSRLYVQAAMYAEPRAITTPDADAFDAVPMWSPDGREIAFQRRTPGKCVLMVMPASGGEPRRVGQCTPNVILFFDWLPDGRGLIMGGFRVPGVPRNIFVLPLDTGEWRPFAYEADGTEMDIEPRVSPDGQWLAFRRGLGPADLWRVPLSGGQPERLTHLHTEIWGLDWTADGRGIVFSSADGSVPGLFRLDIATRRVERLGIAPASYPDVAARAEHVAYEIPRVRRNLAEFAISGTSATPQPVLGSSGNEWAVAVDEQARHYAFYSDRSGEDGLWLAQRDADRQTFGEPQRVVDLVPAGRFPPSWSADGSQLLVAGQGRDGPGLHLVDRASRRSQRLALSHDPAPDYGLLLDADRLLVGSRDEDRDRLSLYQRTDARGAWTYVRHRDTIGFARADWRRDRLLVTNPLQNGLFSLASDLRGEPQLLVTDIPTALGYRGWDLRGDRLWILLIRNATQMEALAMDLSALPAAPKPAMAPAPGPSTHRYVPLPANGLSFLMGVGQDADHLILGQTADGGHDIGLATLDASP